PPTNPHARTSCPAACRTLATFTPLPPARVATERTRVESCLTRSSTQYVTSSAGLGVTVRITPTDLRGRPRAPATLRREPPDRHAVRRRSGRHRRSRPPARGWPT